MVKNNVALLKNVPTAAEPLTHMKPILVAGYEHVPRRALINGSHYWGTLSATSALAHIHAATSAMANMPPHGGHGHAQLGKPLSTDALISILGSMPGIGTFSSVGTKGKQNAPMPTVPMPTVPMPTVPIPTAPVPVSVSEKAPVVGEAQEEADTTAVDVSESGGGVAVSERDSSPMAAGLW